MRSPADPQSQRRSTQRLAALVVAIAIVGAGLLSPSAQASFGLRPGSEGFEATPSVEGGGAALLAGSHPYELTVTVGLNLQAPGAHFSDGDLRDLRIEEPPGMIEDPQAVPECSQVQFNTPRESPFETSHSGENCPDSTQIGTVTVDSSFGGGSARTFGVFNLAPPPGIPSEIGFAPYGDPIVFDSEIRDAEGEYGLTLSTRNFPQRLDVTGFQMVLWGYPWDVTHDGERGDCLNEGEPGLPWEECSVGSPKQFPPQPYLSLPTSCSEALGFTASADSWQQPATVSAKSAPLQLEGCESLLFGPQPTARFTNPRASSPTGYEFKLLSSVESPATHRVPSQDRTAVVSLPEGVTLNPSVGAGLGVCTPAQYAAETASSPPGAGCPNPSKIGDFTVRSPLFEEAVNGAIFLAQPFHNPSGSLIALYLVAKAPQRGIIVKVSGRLEANEATGRLTAIFESLPQLPYDSLEVRFRESQRAPLVTPSACGTYETHVNLTPWLGSLGNYQLESPSQVSAGIGGGPCPTGTVAPFAPQAKGGTLNQNAGSYTPFYLHLTRNDIEQEITSYSAKLPPGLLGKIAGIPYCSEAALQAAKVASGIEELEHPSCPAASEIGHTISGYGVGSTLAYAPGKLYLAGPYHGSSFSVVAIDSALVGPFDLGTIIVRSAIEVDPHTAQVSIDSAGSDPIPHIIDGIPIHLRDVRVYLSRPGMMLNPTDCDPFTLSSSLTGSNAPFANPRDVEATATVPYAVSYCSSLGFAPKFNFSEKGRVTRAGRPALSAHVSPRPGDANISTAIVTLPHALYLEQGHIEAVCTRPQLANDRCPQDSIYGHASVTTQLLGGPLSGSVYLAASASGKGLPELVVLLEGQGIRILLNGRIDSPPGAGMRATFEGLPDAPFEHFSLTMKGGKKGILVNSANLCTEPQVVHMKLIGQNDAGQSYATPLKAGCKKQRKHTTKKGRHR